MGYRSEVEIMVYGDPLKLDVYMAKWIAESREYIKECVKSKAEDGYDATDEFEEDLTHLKTTMNGDDKVVAISFEDVKWYDGYTLVTVWNNLWQNHPESLNAEFARIGEHDDDIEISQTGEYCDYLLQVSRTIVRDLSLDQPYKLGE